MINSPIRVLHVFGYFGRGGAESMVMNLYRSIDKSVLQFGFVVHGDKIGDFEEEAKSMGAEIFRVPEYKGINHLAYVKAWEKILKDNKNYSVVHGHVRSTANIYLKIANKEGYKTIAHSHNTSSGNGVSASIKNVFQYNIRNQADEFIGCSLKAGQWLFGDKICNQENFHVLNNAIDSSQFSYDNEKRNIKRDELGINDKIAIGHVGRFHKQKNHDFLIDIFFEVQKLDKNVVLILVGEGELKETIQKKVEKLNISNKVKFLNSRSDVNELLQAFDLFLFPSLFEGLPVTLVETQAAGLPSVISDTITDDIKITEFITYMSLDERPSNWAELVLKTIDASTRRDTSADIKSNHYDIEITANWYTSFIKEITNKK